MGFRVLRLVKGKAEASQGSLLEEGRVSRMANKVLPTLGVQEEGNSHFQGEEGQDSIPETITRASEEGRR